MTRHTKGLAQHLAWALQGAGCRDHTAAWAAHEAGYATATTNSDAELHLRASQELCGRCPVIEECAERASVDCYTGLAAGTAYRNGRPQHRGAGS